jgi:hypothetical protein
MPTSDDRFSRCRISSTCHHFQEIRSQPSQIRRTVTTGQIDH